MWFPSQAWELRQELAGQEDPARPRQEEAGSSPGVRQPELGSEPQRVVHPEPGRCSFPVALGKLS
jgi:hypothetical protein